MGIPTLFGYDTDEKASQTDGFQSIRRIDRYPLRHRPGAVRRPSRYENAAFKTDNIPVPPPIAVLVVYPQLQ
jgi:hypothetical protein